MTQWAEIILNAFKLLADARVRTAFFFGVAFMTLISIGLGTLGARQVLAMHDEVVEVQRHHAGQISQLQGAQTQTVTTLLKIQGLLTDIQKSVTTTQRAVIRMQRNSRDDHGGPVDGVAPETRAAERKENGKSEG